MALEISNKRVADFKKSKESLDVYETEQRAKTLLIRERKKKRKWDNMKENSHLGHARKQDTKAFKFLSSIKYEKTTTLKYTTAQFFRAHSL